jgi:hypothetical protein
MLSCSRLHGHTQGQLKLLISLVPLGALLPKDWLRACISTIAGTFSASWWLSCSLLAFSCPLAATLLPLLSSTGACHHILHHVLLGFALGSPTFCLSTDLAPLGFTAS